MNRREILAKLRENEAVLRARGVSHVARTRAMTTEPAHVTVFNYAGVKEYIANLFHGPVDVVSREGLKPYIRPAVTTDAIYAF